LKSLFWNENWETTEFKSKLSPLGVSQTVKIFEISGCRNELDLGETHSFRFDWNVMSAMSS
jgi:hypothetical protein